MASTMSGVYSVLDDERLELDFFQALGGAMGAGFSSRITTEVDTDSEVEKHGWLGAVAVMREWLGPAIGKELASFKAFLMNKDYESTMHIQKGDLRRDKTGQIRRRITQLGQVAGRQRDILISSLITNGETASGAADSEGFRDLGGRCYDNQAFFDTDHDESGTNQTNDLSSTEVPSANVSDTAAPTAAEMEGIITESIGHFYTLTDDQGEPINADSRRFQVQVPNRATYWAAASAAINSLNLTSGETNRLKSLQVDQGFSIDLVMNSRLSSSDNKVRIFVEDDGSVGPFVWQEEVEAQLDENDPGSTTKYVEVITWGTHAAGYALWQKALVVLLS